MIKTAVVNDWLTNSCRKIYELVNCYERIQDVQDWCPCPLSKCLGQLSRDVFPPATQRSCPQQSKRELYKLNWREINNCFLQKERQKLIVDQLRRQNSMKRILVSDAISSLVVENIMKLFFSDETSLIIYPFHCTGLYCQPREGGFVAAGIHGEEQRDGEGQEDWE